MKQNIFKALSYAAAFTLGLYASSQFKFSQPIEWYRWVITILCFVLFITPSKNK